MRLIAGIVIERTPAESKTDDMRTQSRENGEQQNEIDCRDSD